MLQVLEHFGFYPKRCTWELTLACNLRCQHCGSRAGKARPDELSTAQALGIIDDLAAMGCEHISFAGGEPTLRKDWPELVARCRAGGVHASLVSNGLTWNDALTQTARRVGVRRMAFSLDGLETTHNCNRGANKSFRKVLAAIQSCVRGGVSAAAITSVTRDNLDELERIHALLRDNRVDAWQVQIAAPQGYLEHRRDLVLDAQDTVALVRRLTALKRLGGLPAIFVGDNIGYYGDCERELRGDGARLPFWVGCRAGLTVVGIESHGDVKGCLSLPSELNGRRDFVEGNLQERSLRDIWTDPAAFAYTRKFQVAQLKGACSGCAWGEICRGGCTFASVAHSGVPHAFPNCYHALSLGQGGAQPTDEAAGPAQRASGGVSST